MGKVTRIKGDLDDVEALLEIISVLKDVSTNRFFSFAQKKQDFAKFLEVFLGFFNMLEGLETDCPLVRNNNPVQDILIICSDAGFMSQLNSRVCSATFNEAQKHKGSKIICVGTKGAEKCRQLGLTLDRVYQTVSPDRRYGLAMEVRDYVIERVMSGASGSVASVYIWPKSFNILKPRVVRLLPASELMGGEEEPQEGEAREVKRKKRTLANKDFVAESTVNGFMRVLADIWVSSRLFEMLSDTQLAEAAAQAQQLESSIEGLSKEKGSLMLSFRKAGRDELNKAMREVFTSSSVIRKR